MCNVHIRKFFLLNYVLLYFGYLFATKGYKKKWFTTYHQKKKQNVYIKKMSFLDITYEVLN